jgi:hypothetical protein
VRAIGRDADSASIDLDAPRGNRVRTTDVSGETARAFHAGRFLGTAPRRATRKRVAAFVVAAPNFRSIWQGRDSTMNCFAGTAR